MKKILLMAVVVYSGNLMAQPKLITQATITTTTNVVSTEEEDVSNIASAGEGGGRFNFRNFADGETKSVTYLKNDLVKTVIKSDMGRITTIRDNAKKLTTNLMEMMGNKTGYYATDEDQAEMRKKIDSMMSARRTTTSSDTTVQRMVRAADMPVDIVYTEETKKIAGYNCKKAYVVTTRFMGIKDSSVIWYTPEIKLQNITTTGGMASFGGIGASPATAALSKIDGFVMRQESKMGRNRNMTIEVNKIETGKEIADKEFDIPKDFVLKPMKEMQSGMQGRGPGGENRTFIRVN